jgi:signal peptidase
MSPQQKNVLTLPDATRSSWSAEGSALVAETLRASGCSRLRVHGESMLPALWPGDVVEIASCSPEDVQPGEIVLALRDGRLFLHRLLAPCKPNGFLLRGDSMPGPDPPFPPGAMLGRLVRRAGEERGVAAFTQRGWFAVQCSRALGTLLCHCGPARRLALKLHSRWTASSRAVRIPPSATDTSSRDLSLSGLGNL